MPRMSTVTVPKFVVPLVSVVAAAALGVAGVFVGSNLTAPGSQTQQTQNVPVAGATAADGSTPTTGTRNTVTPQPKTVKTDPVMTELMRQLASGATPEQAVSNVRRAASDPPAPGGDPCSPAGGTPGGDCPDGLHGAVFADTATPDIVAGGQALPPTQAEYAAHGNPAGAIWCPAVATNATTTRIGIFSSLPATVNYEYWPTADRSTSVSGHIDSPASEISAFQSDLARGVAASRLPLSQHCQTLSGLTPNTAYTVLFTATDYLGRTSAIRTFTFNSAGAPTRPTVQFVALGPNVMSAIGYHEPDQTLEFKAWVVPTGTTPNCPLSTAELIEDGVTELDVSADELTAHNYISTYTKKTAAGWIVPEGSTILFCARWYNGTGSHSWQRTQPIYQVQQLFQSPNRLVPTVTVLSATAAADSHATRTVTVSTSDGVWCGEVDLGGQYDQPLPAVACSGDRLSSGNAQYVDGVGFQTSGTNALDLTVTTDEVGGGPSAAGSITVPDATGGCFGVCTIPADQQYSVPFRDAHGNQDGAARILVSWSQGNSSWTGGEWGADMPEPTAPGYVTPDLPQMDTDAGVTVSPDFFRHTAQASFTLTVDRPVTYSISLSDAGPDAGCVRPGGVDTLTGHATGSVPISFQNLCLGEAYWVHVDLTDAAGHTAHWGLLDRQTWWQRGQFTTPAYPGTIRYQWGAYGPPNTGLQYVDLYVNNTNLNAVNERGGGCISDGIAFGTGSVPANIAENSTVFARIRIGGSRTWTPTSCPLDSDVPEVNVAIPVTLADLSRPDGALITVPGADGLYLHLWLDPRS